MKATLLVLALCLAVVALPASAEAHTDACLSDVTVVSCMADCTLDHLRPVTALPHMCYIIVS